MINTPFSELKRRAWGNLSNKYLYCLGAALLTGVIAGVASTAVSSISGIVAGLMGITIDTGSMQDIETTMMATSLVSSIISSVLTIPVTIFVSMPLSVGLLRFFVNTTRETHNLEDIFFAYKNRLGNVVLISFLSQLFIFLWTCLLIVPGIIKSYEYSMIPYILAENPAIDRKRAFALSKELTKGNKFRIFLFELSFIGWILLGLLACGIGMVFVIPYINASKVQLYFDLKENAIARGAVGADEFVYPQDNMRYNY